ncbi:MAG: 4Fe-4S binding protein [Chromatiales bacterium]|nr:4Fe-4S binding protein [Chromatiales bacterium]
MNPERRAFLLSTGKLLVLSASASVAWDAIVAGRPETAPNYTMTDHWWGMAIDIEKCIGCGNCVRACKTENDVPREPYYFRTWVERYHVPSRPTIEHPEVDSPNGGYDGFPERYAPRTRVQELLRARSSATTARTRRASRSARWARPSTARTGSCWSTRPTASAAATACRRARTAAASSTRARTTVDKCTLCYHRITKGLTTACCETCPTGARQLGDLKNPKDPIHEFLRDAQGAGAEAADGDRLEGVLQRPRRLGAVRRRPWRRRCHGVEGFMYPNEIELQWSVLIVLYPFITGLVAGAFILASLERVFNVEAVQADLPPGAADRAGLPAGGAAAAAAAPRPPRAVARDVPDAAHRPRRWRCSASSTSGT